MRTRAYAWFACRRQHLGATNRCAGLEGAGVRLGDWCALSSGRHAEVGHMCASVGGNGGRLPSQVLCVALPSPFGGDLSGFGLASCMRLQDTACLHCWWRVDTSSSDCWLASYLWLIPEATRLRDCACCASDGEVVSESCSARATSAGSGCAALQAVIADVAYWSAMLHAAVVPDASHHDRLAANARAATS
jgi:hypothetical protein